MTDDQLRSDAHDELSWERQVDDASIAVDAHDGVVTLRGTVGSFREKREARPRSSASTAPSASRTSSRPSCSPPTAGPTPTCAATCCRP
jgi:hypothetical protein